ncbi:hypothetical protein BLN97_33275 [Bradyrhizobium elkanii]|nr:hypothetical protein BLN97_33275 [Bradyrhizobium elkanii]
MSLLQQRVSDRAGRKKSGLSSRFACTKLTSCSFVIARLQLLADGRRRIPDFIDRLTKLFLRDTERMSPAFHLVGRMQIDL